MFLAVLLILFLIFLLCLPAFPLQEDVEPVNVTPQDDPPEEPPEAQGDSESDRREPLPGTDRPKGEPAAPDRNTPTPGQIRILPSLNDISATALQAARTQHITTLDAILGVTAENLTERRQITDGPFRAQVLMSYDKDHPFRPPSYIANDPEVNASLPWVVARIDEIHANIPHPGAFDPNGSIRDQVLHLSAIKQHYEVGCFVPFDNNPDAYVPQPGEIISVTYTDAATFSGGRYQALATTDNKIPTRIYNDNPCPEASFGSNLTQFPAEFQGLYEFLLSEDAVSNIVAQDIVDRTLPQGLPPQQLWPNIVQAARFVTKLRGISGQNITVYGDRSAWRPGSSGAHGTFHALDITCRDCTNAVWNRTMQYCIDYWIKNSREQRMGLGLYIEQPRWNVERQIHIDFNAFGRRRWVHGQDETGDGRGDPVHEYMVLPSDSTRRTQNWVAISDNVDGWPSGRSVSEVTKDVFFHLVFNPGNDGYITEREIEVRFDSRMGIERGFLGAAEWFLFNGEVVPNYRDGDPRQQ